MASRNHREFRRSSSLHGPKNLVHGVRVVSFSCRYRSARSSPHVPPGLEAAPQGWFARRALPAGRKHVGSAEEALAETPTGLEPVSNRSSPIPSDPISLTTLTKPPLGGPSAPIQTPAADPTATPGVAGAVARDLRQVVAVLRGNRMLLSSDRARLADQIEQVIARLSPQTGV